MLEGVLQLEQQVLQKLFVPTSHHTPVQCPHESTRRIVLALSSRGHTHTHTQPPHAVLEKELFSLVERVLEELVAPGNWQESSESEKYSKVTTCSIIFV